MHCGAELKSFYMTSGLAWTSEILVLLHLRVNVFIPLDRIFPEIFFQIHPNLTLQLSPFYEKNCCCIR